MRVRGRQGAWAPGWDDTVMAGVYASEDPEEAGLRMLLGPRYDAMSADERARRRIGAEAFIAEERSLRAGTPPYDVSAIKAPLVYGRSHPLVMPMVVRFLERSAVGLSRHNGELYVTVGNYRREISLPRVLAQRDTAGAAIDDGKLRVRFTKRKDAKR